MDQLSSFPPELRRKFARVRLLAVDVDGVLTDGGVYIGDDGKEYRRFNIKDGMGLAQAIKAGYQVAIISGSQCQSVKFRAAKLDIEHVYLGVVNKLKCVRDLCTHLDIDLGQVMFIGDDIADLEVMKAVGLACAPADAAQSVLEVADYICKSSGGHGAVREVCDLLNNSRQDFHETKPELD